MVIQLDSSEQNDSFLDIEHKMFFNILIRQPDISVLDFVTRYFPIFTKPVVPGGWTSHPPIADPPPQELTVHSLIFTRHPFFDLKFREGQLNMFGRQMKGKPMFFRDISVSFTFDNKKGADIAFEKLTAMFKAASKIENRETIDDKSVADYSNPPASSIHFVLTKDELYKGKYKIIFRQGSFESAQWIGSE